VIVDPILEHPAQLGDHLSPYPTVTSPERPEHHALQHARGERRNRELLLVRPDLDGQWDCKRDRHAQPHEV
jgi:hypothetical protein